MNPKATGNLGEVLAVKYLENKKYKILARNFKRKWTSGGGEIDIIAQRKDKIIFVEVKTIKQKEGFSPEDEITFKKKRQLVKMVQVYLQANKIPLDTPLQIDILAIELESFSKNPKIKHIENAIEDFY